MFTEDEYEEPEDYEYEGPPILPVMTPSKIVLFKTSLNELYHHVNVKKLHSVSGG